ncbi:FHA domain-containing protein [Butyrivibrio sp. INlla16]|uniref:FHA domain-containing protein n=1 Tax=Butyrivibrio sp. INlla16 TaxID=1520807 RepID=UPI00087F013D|nr:FHA domain-containing protein [Butyrivibrio sp. INlla16]SDB19726.1 FHA domain-containing protein [Butyrivibrio sp. INlla16]
MFKVFKKTSAIVFAVLVMTMSINVCAAEDSAADTASVAEEVVDAAAEEESSEEQIEDNSEETDAETLGDEELSEDAEGEEQVEEEPPIPYATNINEAKNGVVQVNYVYVDDNEKSHIVMGGTGFLIGFPDGNEYVLTSAHILELTDDVKKAAFKYFKVPKDSYDSAKMDIQVVVENDITTPATLVSKSDELDVAVLQLSKPILTRTPLAIITSEDGNAIDLPYEVADKVYALGFPEEIMFSTNEKCYSNDRVVMSSGDIVNLTTINDIQTIQHSAEVGNNNCGGPLIDENGNAIGINTLGLDGSYYCAVDSTVLVKLLDAQGIQYSKLEKQEELPVEEETEEIIETPEVEKEIVVEQVTPKWMIILVIVLGLLLITVITVMIILLVRKRKEKASGGDDNSGNDEAQILLNPTASPSVSKPSSAPAPKSDSGKIGDNDTGVMSMNVPDIKGTTVLAYNNESSGPRLVSGSLIRKKDLKNILIDKEEFSVGKDALHVSYCINDNGAISRTHAIFRSDASGVYVEDCNSTNGTFVNGRRIPAGQPVLLMNGDIVRLANEEFSFKS